MIRSFTFSLPLLLAGLALGQFPPLTCTANAGGPPTVRAEGVTELVGDVILQCIGGAPTPAGQPIPPIDVRVTLNTQVTSKFIGSALTDALLLIDDPQPVNQFIYQGIPGTLSVPAQGNGVYTPSPDRPTIFPSTQRNPNSLIWQGVPIDPPDPLGFRRVRVTNVRANANQLGAGEQIKVNIQLNFSSTGAPIPVIDPFQILGTVQPGLGFSVSDRQSVPSAAPSAGPIGTLRFAELFPNAFRTRTNATVTYSNGSFAPLATNQNTPGVNYNSESGLIPRFADTSVGTTLAGLVDAGTRVLAAFTNVPAGAQIFVSGLNTFDPANPNAYARAITSDTGPGVFQPLQGNGFYQLPVVNGTGTAVWEILNHDPTKIESYVFPIDMVYNGTPLAQTNLITVNGSLGPSPTLPNYLISQSSFNRPHGFAFINDSAAQRLARDYLALVLGDRALAELRTNNAGDTNLHASKPECAISNIPIDPFGTATQYGTCTLNYFGGMTYPGDVTAAIAAATFPRAPFLGPEAPGRAATTAWLTATPNLTAAPATFTVSVDPTGLAEGIYDGTVTATAAAPGVGPAVVPVTFTVRPANVPKTSGFATGNVASYANNVVSPGEAVVIFGFNLGPSQIVTLQLTNNVTDTLLGGTRVLFDGVPAPMIYSVAGQVACFVPFSVAGKKFVTMEVEYLGVKSAPITLAVAAAVPGLSTFDLSGGGQGAILNQDNSSNAAIGALPGEIVQMFGTGGGVTVPPALDGHINAGTSALAIGPIKAFIDGEELPAANIIYAGPAPLAVEGVIQVNLRLPLTVRRNAKVPVVVQFGAYSTQPGVTINVN